jgi:hypothetical protein
MEKVVHLLEILETIFYFNFSTQGKVLFLVCQNLELLEFVLNRLNSDFYSNGADPAARTVAGAHASAAGSPPMPLFEFGLLFKWG